MLNKIDLTRKFFLPDELKNYSFIEISAITGHGIESLKNRIEEVSIQTPAVASDLEIAVNERHANALVRSIKELKLALTELNMNSNVEVLAQQIRIGFSIVGEIVGKTTTEDLLENIFNRFCIGK